MHKKIIFFSLLFALVSCGGSSTEDSENSNDASVNGSTIIDCIYPDSFQDGEIITYVVTKSNLFNGTYSLSKASSTEVDVVLFNPDGSSSNYTFTKGDCSYVSKDAKTNYMASILVNYPDFLIAGASDYLSAIEQDGTIIKELLPIVESEQCESQLNSEPWSSDKHVCVGDFTQEATTFRYTTEVIIGTGIIPGGKSIQRFIMKVDENIVFEVLLTEWNFI